MPQQPPALDETVRIVHRVPDDRARDDDTTDSGIDEAGDEAAAPQAASDEERGDDHTVRFGSIAVEVPLDAPVPAGAPQDRATWSDDDATARLSDAPVPLAHPVAQPDVDDTQPVMPGAVRDAASPDSSVADVEASGAHPDDDDGRPRETTGPRRPWWRRRAVLVPAAAVAVLGAAYGVDLLLADGEIPRHTVVAGVDIGGLTPSAAQHTLQARLVPRIATGRTVLADEAKVPLSPTAAGLTLDVRHTVDAAARQPLNPWTRLTTLFGDRTITPVIARQDGALTAGLNAIAQQVDHAPVDATITIDGTTPKVAPPADGRALDRRAATTAITAALAAGTDPTRPIRVPVRVAHPHVSAATAQRVLDETVHPALSAPVALVGQDGAHRTEIPVSAIAASLTFTPKADGSLAVTVDPAKLQAALGTQLAVYGTAAKDAHFEVSGDSIHVVPSVDGVGVDPGALAQQLMPVLTRTGQERTVTAQLGPVKAAFTTEQAQALGITEKVSSFTTNFSMSPSATNIRVVAEKVNGALVKPGETFSLNGFTGTRGSAQGYIPAPVIEGGQLTNAVGGGISQFATTMFNAAFFAGVQDVHHQPHSFYISRYPAGREATVFDGLIDLSWKNDSNTGIYVQTQWVSGGSLTVTFWGTKHYTIESVSSEKRNITEPTVIEKPDDGKCIPMAGAQGFDITVTRVFHDLNSGAVLKRENFSTHYQPEAILHCVKPPAPAAPGG